MKMLLIFPRIYLGQRHPSLGSAYLATAIKKTGTELDFLDFVSYHDPLNELIRKLKKRPDIIGISLYSNKVKLFSWIIKLIERFSPTSKIIVGGPHVTCDEQSIFRIFPNLDYAVYGEGEIAIEMLLHHLNGKGVPIESVPNLIYRSGEKRIKNPQIFHKSPEDLGFPDWSIYKELPIDYHSLFGFEKALLVMATRGCPYDCAFCSGNKQSGRITRKRPVEHVIEEIKLDIERYGVRRIFFSDENLTLHKDYTISLANAIIENDLNIEWAMMFGVDITTIEKDYFMLLERSGLKMISIAYESGSQRIIDIMNKGRNKVKDYYKKTMILRENTKIKISGFFITGYPNETEKDIKKTMKMIKKLPIDGLAYFCFQPLPGTKVFEDIKHKIPTDYFYSTFDYEHLDYNFTDIPLSKINLLRIVTLLIFHLKTRIIKRYLSYLFKPKYLIRTIKKFLFHVFGIDLLHENVKIDKKRVEKAIKDDL